MKKILIFLVLLSTWFLFGAVVEWSINPATWLRVTRFGALTGAGLSVLLYPFENRK